MSGLTKAFVVFVTFLSVVLVALLIPFVANTQNWQQQYKDSQTALKLAQETASITAAQVTAAGANMAKQLQELSDNMKQQEGRVGTLQNEKNDALTKAADLQLANSQLQTNAGLLTAANNQQMNIMNDLRQELATRRKETTELQERLILVTAQNSDYAATIDQLQRAVRKGEEKLAEVGEKAKSYETALAKIPETVKVQYLGTGTGVSPQVVPEVPIRGSVTSIVKKAGDTFLQVNVGSKDQVQPNMKFWVHRNGKFLGSLVIDTVDTNSAVGRMTLIQPDVVIAVGDSVLAGPVR